MSLRMLRLQNETNSSCPDLQGQGYRASFQTHSAAKGPRKKIYHGQLEGKGPRKGEHAVVKVFRDGPGTEAQCDAEIDKHRLAQRLARRFNKMVPDGRGRITFTVPLKSTVECLGMGQYLSRHRTGRHLDKQEWVLIEENLVRQGEYQVFLRKSGEVLDRSPTTLDAFLHFTYHESDRKFLLCGFQGVQTENGYLLTTPCIHSEDRSFGASTDGGPATLRKVLALHRCNNLCYSYERPGDIASHPNLGTLVCEENDDEDEENDPPPTDANGAADGDKHHNTAGDSQDSADSRRDSGNSGDEVFPENGFTAMMVMNGGGPHKEKKVSAAKRLMQRGFTLGKGGKSEDLAYCRTDLSSSVIEEIEEEQRKVQQERKENESNGKKDEYEPRRIHLGDQIKKEKPAKQTRKFDTDVPSHRSNVQAIGGIKKRPSF